MTVSLFPRLDPLRVEQCLENLDDLIDHAVRPLTEERLPAGMSRAAIGGGQVTLRVLADLRALLVDAARTCGFPERGSASDRSRFDSLAAVALAGFEPLASGEADRDDVWAFIATVLLPDIVAWRFVNRPAERFEGGVRNALQRLWMRAWALDRGIEAGEQRWKLIEILSEDALVQLTERPSIGADRRLSLAIANAWVRTAEKVGTSSMEDIMRRAIIDLRIRNEIQMLTSLRLNILEAHVDRIFAKATGLEVAEESRPAIELNADAHDRLDDPVSFATVQPEKDRVDEASADEGKTGELEIQHAILRLMLDRNVWSNGALKTELARILPLTEADKGVGARPTEELWENRVNNALGRARGNSLYAKGFVENHGHGRHAISQSGVDYITAMQIPKVSAAISVDACGTSQANSPKPTSSCSSNY